MLHGVTAIYTRKKKSLRRNDDGHQKHKQGNREFTNSLSKLLRNHQSTEKYLFPH